MAKNQGRIAIEASLILEKLDVDTLRAFSGLADSKFFDALINFCRRYAETKKNQILDLPTENERYLANEIATIKGSIRAMGIILDVIKYAQREVNKRKE